MRRTLTLTATAFGLLTVLVSCDAATKARNRAATQASHRSNVETLPIATAEADEPTAKQEETDMRELETITLGAGCFWCIEAVLERFEGVDSVVSGYMGGTVKKPTYEQVCTGLTGHAEVVQIHFDPKKLPLDKLLDVFFLMHDPTTLNRQGPDAGTQYRSAIFYQNEAQRAIAEKTKKKWTESGKFRDPIVTEITPASEFYPAEDYHQEYFAKNPRNPYCRANILPKFKKLGLLKRNDLIP